MLAAIKKGIREHIFRWATNGEKVPVLEQIEDFQNDVKAAAEFRLWLAEDDMLHPSGSESLVGDKRRKEDKKVLRIYFANKTNVKNAPKYVIKVHFIW